MPISISTAMKWVKMTPRVGSYHYRITFVQRLTEELDMLFDLDYETGGLEIKYIKHGEVLREWDKMAITAKWYPNGFKGAMNKELDFESDPIKVMLLLVVVAFVGVVIGFFNPGLKY